MTHMTANNVSVTTEAARPAPADVTAGAMSVATDQPRASICLPSGATREWADLLTTRMCASLVDFGPFEGFMSGAHREVLPAGDPFPMTVNWWTDATKTKLILTKVSTLNAQKNPTLIVWSVYASDGATVYRTFTDTITYSGPFELNRTRTWV